jgi:hypothetical protein
MIINDMLLVDLFDSTSLSLIIRFSLLFSIIQSHINHKFKHELIIKNLS